MNRLAVIVPTFRRPALLVTLLTSLFEGSRTPDQVIVVDNDPGASCSAEWPSTWPVEIVHARLGLNLAGARNIGWRAASADICMFIDDDNTVAPDAIWRLARAATDGGVGLVAPVIYEAFEPTRIWCAGVNRSMWTTRTTFLHRGENGPLTTEPWSTDEMPDAFAVPRSVLTRIGGFDDFRFPFHYDEADLGARIRQLGLRTIVIPSAVVWHSGGTFDDPGLEMARAYQLSGRRRVELMVYARVVFHGIHSRGVQRLVALGAFMPLYVAVVACASVRATRTSRLAIVMAMVRGLRAGYASLLRPRAEPDAQINTGPEGRP
jgi:GT2 family glycosyltransferase